MSTATTGYNRSTLLEILTRREAVVKFRKVNGDLRELRCTLVEEDLPARIENEDSKKKPNDQVITVWDLDLKEWRSFRTDRVLEVR